MSELATFTFHSDPGHAWLEVTMAQLVDVGLEPSSLSPYSYCERWGGQDIFYLEEDEDAAVFVGAYLNKYGKTPSIRELHIDSDHRIRRMESLSLVYCNCGGANCPGKNRDGNKEHLADTLEWVLVCLDRATHEGSGAYDYELESQAGWVKDMCDEINDALKAAGR